MKLKLLISSLLFAFSCTVFAEIQTREVNYELNGVKLKGLMAWDNSSKQKRPGVLVVHEWWGANDYARKRAIDLAKEGYVGFALDMYGDNKVATHPDDAGKFATEIMSRYDEMLARFNAGKAELKQSEWVDVNNIGAIGYCFGGAVVLNVARSDNELKGVVSFHGNLDSMKNNDSKITTAILVLNGADDPFVKAESIEAFKLEMESRDANYSFINYAGATHSFTNPNADAVGKQYGMPLAYNKKVDKESWKEMKQFFAKAFNSKEKSGSPAPRATKY